MTSAKKVTSDFQPTYDMVIVGGGISGLSFAYFYQQQHSGKSLLLVDPKEQVGGWTQTITLPSGQTYEAGPRCLHLRGKTAFATNELIVGCGLENRIVKASKTSNTRYVLLDGTPTPLPSGLFDLVATPIGRELCKKIFLEPFQKKGPSTDESVASFFARRAPSPLIAKLAEALVTGIWGGDASSLSMIHAFGELKELEQAYGSCLRGVLCSMFSKKPRPPIRGICTFINGLSELIHGLEQQIQTPILTNTSVFSIDSSTSPISLTTSQGTILADKVVLALPARAIMQLVPSLLPPQHPYPHASFATAVMGWKEDVLERQGYGILAPRSEDAKTLGIVFDSCVFPEQNRPMKTRLTVIMGGVRWPEVAAASDTALLAQATASVQAWTGISKPPDEYAILRANHSIPQPPPHAPPPVPFVASPCHRIFAISSSLGGISINHCTTSAKALVQGLE